MDSNVTPEQLRERARIRALFRSVTGTTFVLLVVLLLASTIKLIEETLFYVLFAAIFVIDFSLHAYLIWKHKIFWFTTMRPFEGTIARVISVMYGALALICALFAIFVIAR